jgi:hypothetical protein
MHYLDGVGTLTEIEGNMNTTKYLETLGDNGSQQSIEVVRYY